MDGENRKKIADYFMQLPQPKDRVQHQYVYVDGSLTNLRTKSQTLPKESVFPEELPVIEFCGSATDFDVGDEADYYSHPVNIYNDPFRRGKNKLVYCETRTREGLPTFANNRHRLRQVLDKAMSPVSDFSFHQSYSLLRPDNKALSYMKDEYNPDSKTGFSCGREIAESHYKACLYAGVKISSLEPVSSQGQWKYVVGPCKCTQLGDDVWISRFLLIRVAEAFGVTASFDSSADYNCLKPLSTEIEFFTDHLVQPQRQRIIDNLFMKLGMNDPLLEILTPPTKIIIKEISSSIDPYSILTKLFEIIPL